jgi:hypothetical protein
MLELIFALTALAATPTLPVPDAGQYSFQGDIAVTMKLHYAVVYGFTPEGAKELDARRDAGEECWPKMREIWLCKSFPSFEGAAEVVRSRVERELAGKKLVLGALRGEPSVIHQGQIAAEYSVPQRAEYDGYAFDSYRLADTQGSWSVRLGNERLIAQFNIENGLLAMPLEIAVTLSREAYDVYVVMAGFRRM